MLDRVKSPRVLIVAAVLAGSAAMGWVGGVLWWQWWSPPPDGIVYRTTQGLRWVAEPIDAGSARLFSATAEYVVIAAGLGILLGLLIGLLARGWELLGLLLGVFAAGIAGWLMVTVGTDLSPPDPQTLAAAAGADARLPGAMRVAGWSPYLAWPAGVLLGELAVLVLAPIPAAAAAEGSTESVGGETVARHVGGGE